VSQTIGSKKLNIILQPLMNTENGEAEFSHTITHPTGLIFPGLRLSSRHCAKRYAATIECFCPRLA
jgi:hypothetical protein